MISIRHLENIKTNKNIKSYRAIVNNTGQSQKPLDHGRIVFEKERLSIKNKRQQKTVVN